MTDEDRAAVADDADSQASETENEQTTDESTETAAGDNETNAEASNSEEDQDVEQSEEDETEKRKRRTRSQRSATRIGPPASEIERLKRPLEQTAKAAPAEEAPKPKLDDFESIPDFEAALTEWAVDKALTKNNKEQASQRQADAAENSSKELARAYQDRMKEAKTYIPDFEETMDEAAEMAVSDNVQGLVVESERAPELVYHFAKNPDVLADLNQMSATQAAREIGRLEATLAKPKPRKQSKAPPPVKPVRGGSSTTKPLAEMSMEEYAAKRTKEVYGSK